MFSWFKRKVDIETKLMEEILKLWTINHHLIELNKNLAETVSELIHISVETRNDINSISNTMTRIAQIQNQMVIHLSGGELGVQPEKNSIH